MKDEGRVLLAIALSFLILAGWVYFFGGGTAPPAATQPVAAPPAAPAPGAATAAGDLPPAPALKTAVVATQEREVSVQTDLFDVTLTNRGARIVSWRLKGFTSPDGRPIELIPEFARRDKAYPLAFDLDDAGLARRLNEALFEIEREPVAAAGGREAGEKLRFTWSDGAQVLARKTLVFRHGDPLVDIEVGVERASEVVPVRLTVGPGLEASDAANGGYLHYVGQAVSDLDGRVSRLDRNKAEGDVAIPEARGVRWAGLEETYFAALLIPKSGRAGLALRSSSVAGVVPPGSAPDAKPPKDEPQIIVAVGVPAEGAYLFVGPKKYTLLKRLGHGLEGVVWFSSYVVVYYPAKWIFLSLEWLNDHAVPNYGLAIILATIVLRLLLFPLNQYSMVSMRKMSLQMQRIQPKIARVKEKYRKKKDSESRATMNQELMELYRKEGVNPMGGMSGCLPMLLQFPILIAFYNVLTVAVELRGAPFFGWIQDLTHKDPFFVTPVLMGATMFLQQKMSMTQGMDPAQQRIMLMMPIVFTVMFLNLPAGLVLYWFVNNLLGILQQWLVNRHLARLTMSSEKA